MSIKNILTVDVEDWYHICDIEHILPSSQWDRCESRVLANVEKILRLFNRFEVKGTFFVLGYVAERVPEVVKIIHAEGHEVASHGYGHLQIYKQSKDEFVRDLLRSKTLIEGIIHEKVMGYRAPEWSICKGKKESFWALNLLAQHGFVYDSSVAPLRLIGVPDAPTTPYTVPTPCGELSEFPPLVMASPLGSLPAGGGWGLRILPYRSIRKRIDALNYLGHPALIFCHPSDFDPQKAPLPLPWVKRFVCYGKIKTTEERMIRLLNDFEFTSISKFINLAHPALCPAGRGEG